MSTCCVKCAERGICVFLKLDAISDIVDTFKSTSDFQVYSPAFYVAVDHNRQVIIVTIRGTLSLQVNYIYTVLWFINEEDAITFSYIDIDNIVVSQNFPSRPLKKNGKTKFCIF